MGMDWQNLIFQCTMIVHVHSKGKWFGNTVVFQFSVIVSLYTYTYREYFGNSLIFQFTVFVHITQIHQYNQANLKQTIVISGYHRPNPDLQSFEIFIFLFI